MAFTKTAGVVYGTPAVTLSTTAAAGSTQQAIRVDGQLIAFNTDDPEDVTLGAAAPGSAAFASRIDHVHSAEGAVGDVDGPASSVDNEITRYSGTTGKLIQAYTSNGPTVDDDGIMLRPGQPCFLIYLAATVSNVTGDNTAYTVVFDTTLFDLDSNISSGIFTAPVDGRYQLSSTVGLAGLASAINDLTYKIITSNREYVMYFDPYQNLAATNGLASFTMTTLADMESGDEASVVVKARNGTKVVDVYGSSDLTTSFSGMLVA